MVELVCHAILGGTLPRKLLLLWRSEVYDHVFLHLSVSIHKVLGHFPTQIDMKLVIAQMVVLCNHDKDEQ